MSTPITYVYRLFDTLIYITRVQIGEACARNGNVGNPTKYYKWEALVDGSYVGTGNTRSEAYEIARCRHLKIVRAHNVRYFQTVEAEMKGAYVTMVRH
jgi:hypothetical protein